MVRQNFITGPFRQIEGNLRRKVGQLVRHHGAVYIGATSRPKRREDAHKKTGGSELVLLWRTSSHARAKEAEARLIRWARNRGHLLYEDQRDGGAGLSPDAKEYYVYALI